MDGCCAIRRNRRLLWRAALLLVLGLSLAAVTWPEDAGAQSSSGSSRIRFPTRPKPPVRPTTTQGQMLVQATEIHYDYANERVSAVGNVQIYYNGSVLEANKVIYSQKTKRLRAEGNARLTEASGQVTYGEIMELSDDYRDGFVDSLRVDAAQQTSIAAARAERSAGNFSVFHSGVYTACEPCKDDPKRPPKWQVKAARITHDQGEKMLYFEQAQIEILGVPVVQLPYFSIPDPTVKRKSGFLAPSIQSSDKIGVGVSIPYFWAIAPHYDLTLTPTMTTKQGPLLEAEWRQRTENGAFLIRGMGIKQWDREHFIYTEGALAGEPTPGNREFRGSFESSGQFSLSDKWGWGWDIIAPTDKTFYQDYNKTRLQTKDLIKNPPSEGVSQVYLTGRGDRSYFDVRSMYFYGFSEFDNQGQIPVVHPVLDYMYTFGQPILGGELSYKVNLTSLSRDEASFNAIRRTAFTTDGIDKCSLPTADPAAIRWQQDCLLRGFPGTYSRFSAETTWRRTFTDPYGQVFTPFASLRGDVASLRVEDQPGVDEFLPPGSSSVARVMPTAGLEYRYPFIGVHSWGTQTIEPIAQLIIRPNESAIGKLPNEDAQALIFDDTNLFKIDKYSGYDRIEGGSRANVGVQYTAQVHGAGFFNVLVGQSYQLFGQNSFELGGITNTGLNSGLDKPQSDYIARLAYQPTRMYTFTTRFRWDEDTMDLMRFEAEARVALDRWTFTTIYGRYAPQPELGFFTEREGVLGTTSLKLNTNWSIDAGIAYNIDERKVNYTQLGLSYIDDCVAMALHYITSYSYSGNPNEKSHAVIFSLGLRTLWDGQISQRVEGLPGGF